MRGYFCSGCDTYHDELPFSYGADAPYIVYQLEPHEVGDRVILDNDLCIVDGKHFFIRGCIELPLMGQEENFYLGCLGVVE